MIFFMDRPTPVKLEKATHRWLAYGKGWLEHWLPYLVVKRCFITSRLKETSLKPFKLAKDWQPRSLEEVAATVLYYGYPDILLSVVVLSRHCRLHCVATHPTSQTSIYVLYPFSFYFLLPEPVPPVDYILAVPATRQTRLDVEMSWMSSYQTHLRKRVSYSQQLWVSHLLLYYLFEGKTEITVDEEINWIQNYVVEVVTTHPHTFIGRVFAGVMLLKGWNNLLPVDLRKDVSEVLFVFSQVLEFFRLGLELEKDWKKFNDIWDHILHFFGVK